MTRYVLVCHFPISGISRKRTSQSAVSPGQEQGPAVPFSRSPFFVWGPRAHVRLLERCTDRGAAQIAVLHRSRTYSRPGVVLLPVTARDAGDCVRASVRQTGPMLLLTVQFTPPPCFPLPCPARASTHERMLRRKQPDVVRECETRRTCSKRYGPWKGHMRGHNYLVPCSFGQLADGDHTRFVLGRSTNSNWQQRVCIAVHRVRGM